jgi:AcrR family transcriptional regulator
MAVEGMSLRAIAEEAGISAATAMRIVRAAAA